MASKGQSLPIHAPRTMRTFTVGSADSDWQALPSFSQTSTSPTPTPTSILGHMGMSPCYAAISTISTSSDVFTAHAPLNNFTSVPGSKQRVHWQPCLMDPALIYRPIFFSRVRHCQTRSIPEDTDGIGRHNFTTWLSITVRIGRIGPCTAATNSGPVLPYYYVQSDRTSLLSISRILNARGPFLHRKLPDNRFSTRTKHLVQSRPTGPSS